MHTPSILTGLPKPFTANLPTRSIADRGRKKGITRERVLGLEGAEEDEETGSPGGEWGKASIGTNRMS